MGDRKQYKEDGQTDRNTLSEEDSEWKIGCSKREGRGGKRRGAGKLKSNLELSRAAEARLAT